jgi:hypothetical protein
MVSDVSEELDVSVFRAEEGTRLVRSNPPPDSSYILGMLAASRGNPVVIVCERSTNQYCIIKIGSFWCVYSTLAVEPKAYFALPLGMLFGNKAQWLLNISPGLTFFKNSAFCQQGVLCVFV